MIDCPCFSKKKYCNCCEPLHLGALAKDALQLMRSRFSAYSLQKPSYIIETTHTESRHYEVNKDAWINSISDFCTHTNFQGLVILERTTDEISETVTFKAILSQDGKDISFTEKSFFKKENGKIKYLEGLFL